MPTISGSRRIRSVLPQRECTASTFWLHRPVSDADSGRAPVFTQGCTPETHCDPHRARDRRATAAAPATAPASAVGILCLVNLSWCQSERGTAMLPRCPHSKWRPRRTPAARAASAAPHEPDGERCCRSRRRCGCAMYVGVAGAQARHAGPVRPPYVPWAAGRVLVARERRTRQLGRLGSKMAGFGQEKRP